MIIGKGIKSTPSNWVSTTLGEICVISSGGTPSRGNPNYFSGKIPWIKSGELNYNVISSSEEFLSETGLSTSSAKIFPKNSILIALYGATVGKLAILGIEATTNQAVAGLITVPSLSNKFVYFYLLKNKDYLLSQRRGGAQPNISQKILSELRIPLPSIGEQEKIVNKIEEIFTAIDNVTDNLITIQNQLLAYKTILLNDAFVGKLTKDWRQINSPENANSILERISHFRQLDYETRLSEFVEQKKKWEKKKTGLRPIKPKKLETKIATTDGRLYTTQIPLAWTWTNLSAIAEISGGITKGKNYQAKRLFSVPYLRVANVQDGYFDLNNVKEIKVPLNEVTKYKLQVGDILYTEGGDKDKLGRGAVWKNEIDNCIHQNHIFRARTMGGEINSFYCSLYSQSKLARQYFFANAKQTTNLASISLTVLSNLPIPLPTKAEQDEIVNILETKFSLISYLENTIEQTLRSSDHLRKSVLKKAFEGRLIPADSIHLNPTELIKQIRNEKLLLSAKLEKNNLLRKVKPMSARELTVLELLMKAKKPIPAKTLWQKSDCREDIEQFYMELKKIEDRLVEIKKGSESLLSLKK